MTSKALNKQIRLTAKGMDRFVAALESPPKITGLDEAYLRWRAAYNGEKRFRRRNKV
ncbi:hypothetical protein ACFQ45_16950 [Rhodanobacter aciditrophus]|uniref:Transposase n=1 Tax=Rhodanobacter aciditrophus TaxID=1623218 RepID=A0ABW4B4N7_9GAMM